jgi:predicted RNase H-like HicB family nuclease
MKTEALHDTAYYMDLPYTLILKKDDEGEYVGRMEELQGCVAHGATDIEAVEALKRMQEVWIQDCLDAGDPVPLPKEEEGLPSGKWVQRVPRSLHKRLSEKARQEGVSLNQFVTSILAESLSNRAIQGLIHEGMTACFSNLPTTRAAKGIPQHSDWGEQSQWQLLGPAYKPAGQLTQIATGVINIFPGTRILLDNDDKKEALDVRYRF